MLKKSECVWNITLKIKPITLEGQLRPITLEGALRTVSNTQDAAFVKMLNMVLWIYLGVWICFVIGTCQGFEYTRDT